MKKNWILPFILLLTLSLFGCAAQETAYTVHKNGIDYYVDTVQKTVSDGENTYYYQFDGDHKNFNISITFPDNTSYWYSQSDGIGSGGWSGDYVADNYVSADTLIEVIRDKAPKPVDHGKMVGAILLMVFGMFNIACPRISWYLEYGWWYKNAEPSDAALIFARAGGVAGIILGIMLLFS